MADFTPHQIAKSIQRDLDNTIQHPYVKEFMKGLDFKSKATREKDEVLINFLFSKMKFYADGWIKANALQTASLYENAQFIQEAKDELIPVYKAMNDMVNGLILMVKDKISPETLHELREMERKIQSYLQ